MKAFRAELKIHGVGPDGSSPKNIADAQIENVEAETNDTPQANPMSMGHVVYIVSH